VEVVVVVGFLFLVGEGIWGTFHFRVICLGGVGVLQGLHFKRWRFQVSWKC